MQTFTPDELKYSYSPAHEPIGTIAPAERFTVVTEDCFTRRYESSAGFTPEAAAWVEENLDGVTGPIAVEGALPGQAVAVVIEEIEATTTGAVVVSRCGAHSPADWWHEEERVVNLQIADGKIILGENWSVPARPLIGCRAPNPREIGCQPPRSGRLLRQRRLRRDHGRSDRDSARRGAGRRAVLR